MQQYEGLITNCSRYAHGHFLSAHRDEDRACAAFVRRRAFVWHLSRDFVEDDGGCFVDMHNSSDLQATAKDEQGMIEDKILMHACIAYACGFLSRTCCGHSVYS